MPLIRFSGLPALTTKQDAELIDLCYGAVRNVPNLELDEDIERSVSVMISDDYFPGKQPEIVFIEVFGLLLKPRRRNTDRQMLAENLVILLENFFTRHFPQDGERLIECSVAPFVKEHDGFASKVVKSAPKPA